MTGALAEQPLTFTAWPKTPRLYRDAIITEKIDGTNAAVGITTAGAVYAQSRNRIITPDSDNYGFATWAAENAGTLLDDLGPGLHFGEWWGRGIQRNYGRETRTFSLFNVHRFGPAARDFHTPDLDVVPTIYTGTFDTDAVDRALRRLAAFGSIAAPGWRRPEGVVVYHSAAGHGFKALLENDQLAKSDLQDRAA